jgi:hypothetical protein
MKRRDYDRMAANDSIETGHEESSVGATVIAIAFALIIVVLGIAFMALLRLI